MEIKNASVDICHVFEIGSHVDLDLVRKLSKTDNRLRLRNRKKASERYFGYDPSPSMLLDEIEPVSIAGFTLRGEIQHTIFDFGAVLTRQRIVFDESKSLDDFVSLSVSLADDTSLGAQAREAVQNKLGTFSGAVSHPGLQDIFSRYILYSFPEISDVSELRQLKDENALSLAQILRSDDSILSQDVVDDALAVASSYEKGDLTIIDWDAAIQIGSVHQDVFGIIEFALVQQLEMLYLDETIDDHNDSAYEAFSKLKSSINSQNFLSSWGKYLMSSEQLRTSEAELAQLAVDSTHHALNVTNAINLIGDPALIHYYDLASQRFRLRELEQNIERKIGVLEGIYQKYTDREATRRAHLLELIIIILIAFEVVQGLL